MKKYAKTIVAVLGAIATALSTAAVPDAWKAVAASIAGAVSALLVYWVPNQGA